jgi:hypothetical protein
MDRSGSVAALNSLSGRRLPSVDLRTSLCTPRIRSTGAAVLTPIPDTKRMTALFLSLFLLSSALLASGTRPAKASELIVFRSASSAANGDGPTLTLSTPGGVQPGDLMVAGLFDRGSPEVTPPSGWTFIRHDSHGTIYYRFATDSEPASYMWSFSPPKPVVGVIVVYSGVDSAPVSASSGRRNTASHRISAPSVDVNAPGSMVVGFFGMARFTKIYKPAGMTRRALVRSGSGPAVAIQIVDVVHDSGPTGRRVAWAGMRAPNVGELVVLSPSTKPPPPPPPPGPGLELQALDANTALIRWTAPAGTAQIQIYRNGRLIDHFAMGSPHTYTDHLLWRNSTYDYKVRFLDAASKELDAPSGSLTTPSPSKPFPRLYADSSFWNQPIGPNPPLDGNSAAMVSKALVNYSSGSNFTNSDGWGYPIAYADANSKLYSIGCSKYDCDRQVSIRIPRYAKANSGSDHHLVVVDGVTLNEVDMWLGAYDPSRDSWTAGSRYGTDADGWGAMCYQHQRCNGAVAAGFAEPGGVVRPEEIEQGHIDHALVIATPFTRSGLIACPATHTDGKYQESAALPEGARIQLDPSLNVNAQPWAAWQKVVARALQTYGAFVADTSGSLEIRAEANLNRGYDAWGKVAVSGNSPSLSFLPWAKFRVLKLVPC